jgi:hypothetical protein
MIGKKVRFAAGGEEYNGTIIDKVKYPVKHNDYKRHIQDVYVIMEESARKVFTVQPTNLIKML